MTYFDQKTIFNVSESERSLLETLSLNEKDVIFNYDGLYLMFILSSKKHPEIKFLGYIFSSIDDEVLKFHMLEKTSSEVDQYMEGKIDLKCFMKTSPSKKRFREEAGPEGVQVFPLDEKDLNKTLDCLKDGLFHKKG